MSSSSFTHESSPVTLDDLLTKEKSREKTGDRPASLSLKDIRIADKVFQWRKFKDQLAAEENHIKGLVRVLESTGGSLDPVLVMTIGPEVYMVDGHHRLLAYRSVKWSKPIPVEWFEGTVEEARLKALELNIKDKLPMSLEDKFEAAWSLVKEGKKKFSKSTISKMTTVSERTIAYMRALLRENPEAEDDSWSEAKRRQFTRDGDFDPDTWLDEKAEKLAKQLLKVVTPKLIHNPEVLAESLRRIDASLPRRLVEEWPSEVRELVKEWEEHSDLNPDL